MGAIFKLKLTSVGNSLGLILPAEVLTDLNLNRGDEIVLTAAPEGYRLTAYSSEFGKQIAIAGKIMDERQEALRELADK